MARSPRLFGTDGVRGLANADLSPELATAISAAAAGVLAEHARAGGRRDAAGTVRAGRRGSRPARQRRDARGGRHRRAQRRGCGRAACRRAAHTRRRPPHRRARRRPGRDDLGVAQPDARQRHQALRRRRAQAARRRSRTRSRPTSARRRRRRRVPPAATSAGCATSPTRSSATSAHLASATPTPLTGLHVVVDCAHGAASEAAPRAYAAAGARVTALHADPDGWNINDGVGSTHMDALAPRGRGRGRRPGHRPRRRRRPLPRGGRRRHASSTATRSSRSSRSTCTSAASSPPTPSSSP